MGRVPRLVLIEPTGVRREVVIRSMPFRMGRQTGNELTLRDGRISRQQAQIISENGKYILEDMNSRHGTFVNGQRIARHELRPKDNIGFGLPDSYCLIFLGEEASLEELLERVETTPPTQASSRDLYHLGVLLEVARVLHRSMSLEDLLTSVVDAAIQVTHTERGLLMLRNAEGQLEPTVARDAKRATLRPQDLEISSSVLKHVMQSRRELVVSDSDYDAGIQQQASVVRLQLRTVVAIPLEKFALAESLDTTVYAKPAELIGVLYLDSHAPTSAFSELDREVLRSLAVEAATVIENARLFTAARAMERLEEQLKIAGQIQQQLLPKTFPKSPHFSAVGLNIACQSVGGDCYDVLELSDGRYGFIAGDVAGKGISAALLATMLQGAFSATATMNLSPAVVALQLNKFLCERSGEDRYATLFYGVLDPSGRLEYVNAGHVPPLVRSAAGQISKLSSENFPLGMFDFAEYRSGQTVLAPGDFLVVYTDGISEACNPQDDMYGEGRLQEVLTDFTGQTVEELAEAIQASLREFTGGAPQADDMTLVVVQFLGHSS